MWRTILTITIIAILVASPFFLASAVAAEENYCHDQASWAQWDQLVAKSPEDTAFKIMYALRIGLCAMVERQQISIDEATMVFERYREELVGRREEEKARNRSGIAL